MDDMSDTISRRFVFFVMFPTLPKDWQPVIKELVTTIGQLVDDDVEIDRFNAKNKAMPILRLLGQTDRVLPSSI